MADETPEGAPPADEVTQASETPQEVVPPTDNFVSRDDHLAELEALEKRIVDRMKKSQKAVIENSVSEIGEKLSEFDKVVDLLKPHLPEDLNVQDIKRASYLDNLMAQSSSPPPELEPDSPPQEKAPEPASLPTGREAEIAQILEGHEGLTGTEPELMEYAKENEGKPWYLVGQGFATLAESLAARASGNPAGVVAPQAQASNPDLQEAFRKELAEARDNGQYGMRFLRQLQSKYVEQGVPIEDLDISNDASVRTREYLYASEGPR